MFREFLTESTTIAYRAGEPRYYNPSKDGFIGTWGAGIYFGTTEEVARLY